MPRTLRLSSSQSPIGFGKVAAAAAVVEKVEKSVSGLEPPLLMLLLPVVPPPTPPALPLPRARMVMLRLRRKSGGKCLMDARADNNPLLTQACLFSLSSRACVFCVWSNYGIVSPCGFECHPTGRGA